MCGAPKGQQQLATAQSNYYDTLTKQAQAEFADATGVFGTLKSEFAPIFAAGPNQFGYSKAEDTALNSEAATGTGEAYASAEKAVKENLMTEGGGNTPLLPSGLDVRASEGLATAGAEQLSKEESQIKEAGYQQGYQQWLAAAQGLSGAPSVFGTSNSGAGVAVEGGSSAGKTWSDIAAENESPFSAVVGALGGIGGALATRKW